MLLNLSDSCALTLNHLARKSSQRLSFSSCHASSFSLAFLQRKTAEVYRYCYFLQRFVIFDGFFGLEI
jgi:hypothetical protein